MADPLLTAQNMIDRLDGGAAKLRELAGDDGTGGYLAGKVTIAIGVASKEGYGILLAGFETNERVKDLAANDDEVLDALCHLARYHLANWKDEFRLPDGKSVFEPSATRARDLLRMKASAATRSAAEEIPTIGKSALIRPRGSAERPPSRVFTGRGF